VIAYNDIKQYNDQNKYFDFLWTNAGAINNRVIPFLFQGKQLVKYTRDFSTDDAVRENWNFYLNWMRTLLYFADNKLDEDKPFYKKYDFGKNGRWTLNFEVIQRWIAKYARDKNEYITICDRLYTRHKDYLKMIGGEETISLIPEVIEEMVVDDTGQARFK
jgi:hypothetical protein